MITSIIWFNTVDYTPLQLGLFATGTAFWLVSYICIAIGIRKNKYVEMPAGVVCANITWEFIWAFIHPQNMGEFIGIGYKAWAIMDVFFIYATYKYGHKQVQPEFKPYFNQLITISLIGWLVLQHFFIQSGYENGIGGISAYIINILISVTYILMIIRMKDDIKYMSFTSGWAKGLGTAIISVMCYLKWPDNDFLTGMEITCFILDAYYVYLFWTLKKAREVTAPVTPQAEPAMAMA